MKRWTYLFSFIILPFFIYFIKKAEYYYMPPKEHKNYSITKKQDDTIRIAFIGDSWAFFHEPYNTWFSDSLTDKLQHPTIVASYGGCGMTSKEVYDCIFINEDMKSFLSLGFDYCIISAGINDTYRKVKTDYYYNSMNLIIKFMIANNIVPILIEIPDYDIEEAYNKQTFLRKALRHFSMFICGTKMDCKKDFRQSLRSLISKKYNHDVYLIDYNKWNNDFYRDKIELYKADGIHLNDKGYALLDNCIAESIYQSFYKNK